MGTIRTFHEVQLRSKLQKLFSEIRPGQTPVSYMQFVGHSLTATSITSTQYSYKSAGALVRLLHGWKEFILHPYRESLREENDMAHPLRLIKV